MGIGLSIAGWEGGYLGVWEWGYLAVWEWNYLVDGNRAI